MVSLSLVIIILQIERERNKGKKDISKKKFLLRMLNCIPKGSLRILESTTTRDEKVEVMTGDTSDSFNRCLHSFCSESSASFLVESVC